MWERVAPVYMASPMASICETYRHSEQKPARKFCRQKRTKTEARTRSTPKKGETGCVLFFGGRRAVSGGRGGPAPPRSRHKSQNSRCRSGAAGRNPPFFLTVPGRLDTIRYGK